MKALVALSDVVEGDGLFMLHGVRFTDDEPGDAEVAEDGEDDNTRAMPASGAATVRTATFRCADDPTGRR